MYIWFRRQTWRALWIALRRAPKDKKARVNLLRFAASLAIVILWISFYAAQFSHYLRDFGIGAAIVFGLILLIFPIAMMVSRYRESREEKKLEREDPAVSAELKRTLLGEARLVATLVERCASEIGMEKVIPANIQIITRRVLLDRLEAAGLREGLEAPLLDLLLAPDGHWSVEQKERIYRFWEYLYVLRWALGLGELRGLTLDPAYNTDDAAALFAVKDAERLTALASWDMRAARDRTRWFLNRCWTELLARRAVKGVAEEDVARAVELRGRIQQEGYTGDYLIGTQTVSEVGTQQLLWAAGRAQRRGELLALLVEIAGGDKPAAALHGYLVEHAAAAETASEEAATA